MDVLGTVLTVIALGAAGWALALLIANRSMKVSEWYGLWLFYLVALLELGLIGQLVVGAIRLANAGHDVDGLSYVGYLVAMVVIVPLAALWSMAERSRWGSAVLLVGCLAIPVMIVRLGQIWTAHA
jgi:hypothetical protein